MLYTVIARYWDNGQSYTAVVTADSEEEASLRAQEECIEANGWEDIYDEDRGTADWGPLEVLEVIPGDAYRDVPEA